MTRLGTRQVRWLRRRFVGRARELAWLRRAIDGDAQVVYVSAPGGTGKTALLHVLASETRRRTTWIDARAIEPTPEGVLAAIGRLIRGQRLIVLDGYDRLLPCDAWVRSALVPRLPPGVALVIAARQGPSAEWRALPGWGSPIRELALHDLGPRAARALLAARGVPTARHAPIVRFTRGHPLALVLAAHAHAARPDRPFDARESPEVVRALLAQLVDCVPGPEHWRALEACAVARAMTEPLLAAMLGAGATPTREVFEWLASLPFVEAAPTGLRPHDLVRDILAEDLRWRASERLAEMVRRAHDYNVARVARDPRTAAVVVEDEMFLHRDDPAMASMMSPPSAAIACTPAARGDADAICAMVERHEGPRAAAIARHWLRRQLDAATVMRDAGGALIGFLLVLALERTTAADGRVDPGVAAARRFLRGRLRGRDRAVMSRAWMERDAYQAPSVMHAASPRVLTRQLLATPDTAFSLMCFSDPDAWQEPMRVTRMTRFTQVDFTVDGRRFGVFGHDWRAEPPLAWLEHLLGGPPAPPRGPALDRAAFVRAVQDALRQLERLERLRDNALVRARAADDVDRSAAAARLAGELRAAIAALGESPRTAHLARALDRTYVAAAATQLLAAESLGCSFSTYRRHLADGVASVAERLWQTELARS